MNYLDAKSNGKRKSKNQRLRRIWYQMVYRCYNSKCKAYPLYGGRGIKVQESWKDNYFNFEDDLYDSYIKHVEEYGEKDTTLDRIDYNGNYELPNLRWATQEEQANNTSRNFIVIDGLNLTQFSNKYDLPVATVWARLHYGWTIEKIITTPVRKLSPKIYAPTGESIEELAKRLNINKSTIKSRLNRGWTWEKILNTQVRESIVAPTGESLQEIADKFGISPHTIKTRLNRGWTWEEALSNPVRNISKIVLSTGETIAELSERTGISKKVIDTRFHHGWSVEKIINTPVEPRYKYYLPCNKSLKEHCNKNNYNYKTIVNYIKKYNLEPHEALAKYLENKQKRNNKNTP